MEPRDPVARSAPASEPRSLERPSGLTSLAVFIATSAYSGYFPIAPGTVGSAVGLVVYFLVRAAAYPWLELLVILAVLAAGWWSAHLAERYFGGTDPSPVVIDEVAGMLITLCLVPVGVTGAIVAFFVFRVLDIIKPFPADRLESLNGGLGIMSDDVMAGIYGNLVMRLLAWWIPNWML